MDLSEDSLRGEDDDDDDDDILMTIVTLKQ
jgi:hypothetical protein